MADLPPERLKLFSPPFTVTRVDLVGPFHLKYGRNKKIKSWGAVFTCATVRAIHLQILQDLSTEAFLHALRRFAAHHGWPTTIISDNGTSFVGAERELRKLTKEGRKEIEDFRGDLRDKVAIQHTIESSPGRSVRRHSETSKDCFESYSWLPNPVLERDVDSVCGSRMPCEQSTPWMQTTSDP